MSRITDYFKVELFKKCPKCKHENCMEPDEKAKGRGIHIRCTHCKAKFTVTTPWTGWMAYIIAMLAAEIVYVSLCQPNNIPMALSILIMVICMLIVREIVNFIAYLIVGTTRIKEVR